LGLAFELSSLLIVVLILLYTQHGGVKTIVFTDCLQTATMLAGLICCLVIVLKSMSLSPLAFWREAASMGLTRLWGVDPQASDHWIKQILAGAAIALAMTGMDQEMMQKTLSVAKLKDAQKNMMLLALCMQVVVFVFLLLGAALSMFALKQGITAQGDRLFPFIVMTSMPEWLQVVFLIALVSALLPSADGALKALTSSVCHDLLGFERGKALPEQSCQIIRLRVHLAFAILLLGFVWVFRYMDQASMVLLILKLAAFSYGPLMGLFLFAALSKQALAAGQVVLACGLSIVLSLTIDYFQATWFETWRIGLEILVINALICTSFLFVFTKKSFSQSGT
ncbi:MAG: sodium:solute symporter, partial [Oxalobacteraceae bacterium]|nr:sodium:solute symporter [Oxalobacteraceae bacterium]